MKAYILSNISMNSGLMGRLVLKTRISGSLSSSQMGQREIDQGVSFNLSLVPGTQNSNFNYPFCHIVMRKAIR